MRPWLITLGPFVPSTEGRDQLAEIAHNKTTSRFIRTIWAHRRKKMGKAQPVRSLSWPPTCLVNGAYVLPVYESNVTPIKKTKGATR